MMSCWKKIGFGAEFDITPYNDFFFEKSSPSANSLDTSLTLIFVSLDQLFRSTNDGLRFQRFRRKIFK